MHNLKEIRKDFDVFEKSLKKRSVDIDLKKIKDLDEKNRELIQKKETLEKEKKDISKSKDKSLYAKSKEISLSIEKISEEQNLVKDNLENILSNIPNIPHKDVPNPPKANLKQIKTIEIQWQLPKPNKTKQEKGVGGTLRG